VRDPIILADPEERAAERDADINWGDFFIAEVQGDDGESATVTVSRDSVAGKNTFGGWTTRMPWPIQPRPKVGMKIRVWSNGNQNHGVSRWVNGKYLEPVYYKTKREMDVEHAAWIADHQKKQRQDFMDHVSQLDAEYEALPGPLKRRIDRFRDKDPDFRWREEAYEMAACAEAGRLYRAAMDPETGVILKANKIKLPHDMTVSSWDQPKGRGTTTWEDTPENRLLAIDAINGAPNNYNYKLMEELFPWIDPGHSGNTWGHAVQFARVLVRDGDEAKL
jgi:hypothetical protein